MKDPLQVLCCHAPADADSYRELAHHLSGLVRAGKIELWTEADIRAGAERQEAIDEAVARAEVAVFLASATSSPPMVSG